MDTAGGVIEAFNAPLLPLMGAQILREPNEDGTVGAKISISVSL